MAKNYVQDGNTIGFLASADIKSGAPVAIGVIIAVALNDIAANTAGTGRTTGVFSLPKAAGAIEQGAKVFLKDGAITTTSTGAVFAGIAWAGAASGDAEVLVKLNFGA